MPVHARAATATVALALALVACNDTVTPDAPAVQAPRADVAASSGGDHALVNGSEIQWGPALPCFPAGAELAVVGGNPFEAGKVWTVRLLLPSGSAIDPHWHPTDENVTVLSGTLLFGHGEHFDETTMTAYGRGGFFTAPAGMPHYVQAVGRTEVQVHGVGPFALVYVEHTHGNIPDCPVPAS